MKDTFKILPLCGIIALAACAPVQVIDTDNKDEVANMQHVMVLEYRDWENASSKLTKSMIESGAVSKPGGGRYVLAVGRVTNDTMQRIDTDLLVKNIRANLMSSGKVAVSTAITGEDEMTNKVREQRSNAEFAGGTIAKKGTLVAPELSLTGKMIQRNIKESRKERVEYYFQLTLTDINTGLSVWEGTEPIIKRGSKAPTW